jgi:competence protein ComEC
LYSVIGCSYWCGGVGPVSAINLAMALMCGCGVGLLVLGLYPGGLDPAPGLIMVLLALCAGTCAIMAGRDRRVRWASMLIAFAVGGCGSALLTHPPANASDLAYYNSRSDADVERLETEMVGIVSAEPAPGDRSQRVRISAETIRPAGSGKPVNIKGDVLAILPRYPEYSFGERLVLKGKLTAPPQLSGFDYAAWLGRQGVYSYMSFPHVASLGRANDVGLEALVTAARARARETLQRNVAEPQASIAVGVVIGDRSALSNEVREAFRRTGTTHILAISGQNIMLLVGLVWLLWSGRGQRHVMPAWLALLTISSLGIYTLFTGAAAPVVRATVMGAILLLAPVVGRRYDPMSALGVAGAGMILLDPGVLADAGFQLSFLSMWGINAFARPLNDVLGRIRVPGLLSYPLSVSLAAQAATLPLAVLLYGQVPLVSPFATMTSDITLLPLMLSGIVTAMLGLLPGDFLAWLGGLAVWLCSAWLLWWVEWWAQFSWSTIPVEGFQQTYVAAYYATLFAGVWLFSRARRRERLSALWPQIRVAMLGATAAAVWVAAILLVILRF